LFAGAGGMRRGTATLLVMIGAWGLQGCKASVPTARVETAKVTVSSAERNCLIRAMYFESNRTSRDGLIAVGTVVMNRVASPLYPDTICGVVGEPRQFASGVLTRAMNERELPMVERAADAVLKGERHSPIRDAMHFHVAGLRIPYRVHYVAVAGGNAFYSRADRHFTPVRFRRERTMTEVAAAPQPKQANQTAGPGPSLVERLYASLTGAQTSKPCETTNSAFGPKSPACEHTAAGR
jgi:spore germination cell wall hydrolase CwlJ-like protein